MATPSDDVKRRVARAAATAAVIVRVIALAGGHTFHGLANTLATALALLASAASLRIGRDAALALGLPIVSLTTLVAFAVLSGSNPTHGDLLLFVVLALAAATTACAGARIAVREAVATAGVHRIAWGAVGAVGLGIGLLWIGEAIAVLVLNW